jgi:hypothetical protein
LWENPSQDAKRGGVSVIKLDIGTQSAKVTGAVSKRQSVNGNVLLITRLLHRSRRMSEKQQKLNIMQTKNNRKVRIHAR